MAVRQIVGHAGEDLAVQYLAGKGYVIVGRNLRPTSPQLGELRGELDLIVFHEETLVFVEVRTRRSQTYGLPEESITPTKRKRLLNLAQAYLMSAPLDQRQLNWRIDVIAIYMPGFGQSPKITHLIDAIRES
ncbi:MAG: YraN family protein [Chloroflexi bacterium]|nr:YraN family protein [Chloroflexota bacterium]